MNSFKFRSCALVVFVLLNNVLISRVARAEGDDQGDERPSDQAPLDLQFAPQETRSISCKRAFALLAKGAPILLVSGLAGATGSILLDDIQEQRHISRAKELMARAESESVSLDKEGRWESVASAFLNDLDPAHLFNFTGEGPWGTLRFSSEIVSITQLEQLSEELATYNGVEIYKDAKSPRDQMKADVDALRRRLTENGIYAISATRMTDIANRLFQQKRETGAVGEVYQIRAIHHGSFLGVKSTESIAVSRTDQERIDALFHEPPPTIFTHSERILMREKGLTAKDIGDLRALREATKLFEVSTYMRDRLVGGLFNNLRAQIGGEKKQICGDLAVTYGNFVRRLQSRGLLGEFETTGEVVRDWMGAPSHAGTGLRHRRTGQVFVLDAWLEPGGNGARLMKMEDWKNRNDAAEVSSLSAEKK